MALCFEELFSSGLSVFDSYRADLEEVRQINQLLEFIRLEEEAEAEMETMAAEHDAWLEFATECEAEYQAQKLQDAWTYVTRVRTKRETTDKTLICRDCSGEFMFTVYEQEKFQKRNWVEPKTCKRCIDLR